MDDKELRNQVKHLIFDWMGGTSPMGAAQQYEALDKATDKMMALITGRDAAIRIDEQKLVTEWLLSEPESVGTIADLNRLRRIKLGDERRESDLVRSKEDE